MLRARVVFGITVSVIQEMLSAINASSGMTKNKTKIILCLNLLFVKDKVINSTTIFERMKKEAACTGIIM
jgi:hypothetical protein